MDIDDQLANSLNILIVDDEANIRKTLTICLESRKHYVVAVSNAKDALSEAKSKVFDLTFVDLRLGMESGLDLIPMLLNSCPWMKIIVITAYASIDTAVEAMRRGASDYIPKPFTPKQVELVIKKIAIIRSMEQRISSLKEEIEKLHPEATFTSRYPNMQRAIEIAKQVAVSEAIILILGPSGTGKTVLARAIHRWSRRNAKPFGIISCPSLNPELLESELFGHVKGAFTGAIRDNPGKVTICEGGTLFLDEIGALPLQIQSKLLRFIQDREYERVGDGQTRKADVRIITATNTKLENAVKEGRFREDLYYRLNVIPIDIPPLTGRPDDVEIIAKKMLIFFSSQNHKLIRDFSKDAMSSLRNYSWPGNIRELRNVIEHAVILCSSDLIDVEHLPVSIVPKNPVIKIGDHVSLKVIEENHIRSVIASTATYQQAADILGIDQATLWNKRKQFKI